jgi:Abnormal spindle-like microcephaly-assoc'd, ASPM-SPD-2-Hydin
MTHTSPLLRDCRAASPLIFLTFLSLVSVSCLAPMSTAATGTGCVSSAGKWVNATLPQSQTGSFRITYDATPSLVKTDAVSGISSGAATAYANTAAAVRFNPSGTIDVRNGASFTAATRVPYSPGVAYHFILDVNVATHTYSAYVVIRSVQTTLGSNIKFRTEQAGVRSLNDVGWFGTVGGITVCNITLSGSTSTTTLLLNPSATSLNFGSVPVSSSKEQDITLTNAGNSSVTISKVSVSGAGYNATGGAAGLILSPNQTATVRATFAPSATGTQTGAITVTSNAKNSPAAIALGGVGVAPSAHHVALAWNGSSGIEGYNVYVASTSGGPYSRLNAVPIPSASYADFSVQSGHSYYYVVTSVSTANQESSHSSEVRATVP